MPDDGGELGGSSDSTDNAPEVVGVVVPVIDFTTPTGDELVGVREGFGLTVVERR